ncbi:type 4a pilus biogenesis protein PilO [Photobacterium sp. 1_MG-2023]|uniref:type 4a pilus biogenesis protein PilO n=1 Tax=Photobacterium sp. 1_MG-2023 TaxID=3062646 RepID=UPI0026E227EC|nr:type 4a pilus biogenesis protein PilO [Photobacterium sp. 1_MG-2023]MDO6706229.1 type 4a pilus biogenesis protein PilO [Photobacterium sp. 1_MG-2023]
MNDWRDLTLETLADRPARDQLCFCLILSLVVLGCGAYWLLIPLREQTQQLVLTEAASTVQLSQAVVRVNQLPGLQAQAGALEAQFQQQLRRLPDEAGMVGVLNLLQQQAPQMGVQLQHLQWEAIEARDWYRIQPLQFEFSGTYDALGRFLATLAAQSWIFAVHSLSLQAGDGVHGPLILKGRAILYRDASSTRHVAQTEPQSGIQEPFPWL